MILAKDSGEDLDLEMVGTESRSLCVSNRSKDAGRNHHLVRALDSIPEIYSGPGSVVTHRQYSG